MFDRAAPYLRLIRPHQWLKSVFVFTGLLFGHGWGNADLVWRVIAAAAAFALASSATYVMNDYLDREQDRGHPAKRDRPLAAGAVSVAAALLLGAACGIAGLALAAWAGTGVLATIAAYLVLNVAYSLGLKHVVILDVFAIAAGFMLRILAGTLGVGIAPSQWLLLCGFMVTLFLGFAKRRAEIAALAQDTARHRRVLAEYSPVLLDKMIVVAATGIVVSYSLYTMSPETVRTHGTANLIYTVPVVVYGVFRYIYLLHREGGGTDTAADVLRDPHLLTAALAWLGLTIWMIV